MVFEQDIHLCDFVHARRYFINAMESRPGYGEYKSLKSGSERRKWLERSGDTLLAWLLRVLEQFHELFRIERKLKEKKAGPDEILLVRRQESLPVFERLEGMAEELMWKVPANSLSQKACQYFLKRKKELREVFFHAKVPIDSNAVERAVKDFVLCRRNILACSSRKGAEGLCTLFTVCMTARNCGLNVERYLSWVFEQIRMNREKIKTEADFARSLLPYSKNIPDSLYSTTSLK